MMVLAPTDGFPNDLVRPTCPFHVLFLFPLARSDGSPPAGIATFYVPFPLCTIIEFAKRLAPPIWVYSCFLRRVDSKTASSTCTIPWGTQPLQNPSLQPVEWAPEAHHSHNPHTSVHNLRICITQNACATWPNSKACPREYGQVHYKHNKETGACACIYMVAFLFVKLGLMFRSGLKVRSSIKRKKSSQGSNRMKA